MQKLQRDSEIGGIKKHIIYAVRVRNWTQYIDDSIELE